MTTGGFRAGVQPGDGVVARYGEVALVVAPAGGSFTDALVRLVATSYDDPRTLLWQVTALVAAHQPGAPSFALAVGGPPASRVLVHGTGRAVSDTLEVSAVGLWTWAERSLTDHRRLALTVAVGLVEAEPRTDLRDGVLGGAGVVLEPETAAAAPPAASPVESAGTPLRSMAASVFAPLPNATPTPAPTPAPSPARAGIVTPRPPTQEEVRTAIAARPYETVQIADSIAALHADDGTRVPLDRDYVLGRDPRQDPTVQRGMSTPIQVDDGEQLISRIHAYVSVTGTTVSVRDAGSANGTFVAAPGDPGWTRITTAPTPLPVGHSMRLGLRVYTHLPPETPPA